MRRTNEMLKIGIAIKQWRITRIDGYTEKINNTLVIKPTAFRPK